MAEADLGVRVFLIDNLSSPMGLVTGSIAMLGSAIMSGVSQFEAMDAQMIKLKEEEQGLRDSFAAGQITQTEFNDAMAANQMAASELGAEMDALNGQLLILGATLGAGIDFFAFADGIKAADQAASDLQDTLMNVSIAGNLTDQQTQDMQKALFSVSQASIYTGDTVGQAFTMLMEKGQSAQDVMDATGQAAVNMAMAMGEDNATGAATLLASTMQMFQLKADQAHQSADMLTYAFYHGIPSVSGLTQALQQTGGMADYLHIPLSEVVTVLDALGRSGLSGSEAGSSLRYVMQAMYEPTQKEANELEYLGIVTANKATPAFEKFLSTMNSASSALGSSSMKFDGTINSLYLIFKNAQQVGTLPTSTTFLQWADSLGMVNNTFYTANGQQKDFLTSIGILISAIQAHSKTPQQFADAMSQMFNVRSGRGFADLLTQFGGLSDQQKKVIESTYNQGLAAEDAAKKTSTQSAKQKELGTTFTDFMAQVGNPFPSIMSGMFGALNTFFGGLTRGNGDAQNMIRTFLVVGAALSGVALIVGIVVAIFTVLGGALAPIIGIVLLVAGGIALVSAGIALLVHHIQTDTGAMNAWKGLLSILGTAWHAISDIWNALVMPALKELWNQLKQLWTAIQPILPVLEMIGKILLVVFGVIIFGTVIVAILALVAVIKVITWIIEGIVAVINNLGKSFSLLGSLAQLVAHALTDNWRNATSQIGGFFNQIGTWIHNLIQSAQQWGANLVQNLINGVLSKFSALKNMVGNVAGIFGNLLGFHSPTKEGPGADADRWMPNLMHMLTLGLQGGIPALHSAASSAGGAIQSGFYSPGLSRTTASYASANAQINGGNTTLNLNMDGQQMTQVVLNRLTGQLQMAGSGRLLR